MDRITASPVLAGVRTDRPLRRALAAALALTLLSGASAVATDEALGRLTVSTSPFSPNGDGYREATAVSVPLRRPASLTVTVEDFDGRTVRTLAQERALEAGAHRFTWNGRDDVRRPVPDGPYRFRITAASQLGISSAAAWTTRAHYVPYLANPRAITVAIDPGHGGPDPGAEYGGWREADFNLDIALRLREMLRASRINVVITRTGDHAVNVPAVDRTADGAIGHRDELAARIDLANLARADVLLSVHNNAYGCHCALGTETYIDKTRLWAGENRSLAQLVQTEHISQLRRYRSDTWYPRNRGVRHHGFYVLRPHEPTIVPRPSLMPAILGESLFVDREVERDLLRRSEVRQSLAVAYFNGVARHLAARAYGVGYRPRNAPRTASVGASVDYRLAITNRGNTSSSGWLLELRHVPAVALYDGSPQAGSLMASVPVPDGLVRGKTTVVTVPSAVLPDTPGEWLVKADIITPDGRALSQRGVVSLQMPLTTTGAAPTASPGGTAPPEPTLSPEPTPSPGGTAPPEPTPSPEPTP